jgi:hypothetical protein
MKTTIITKADVPSIIASIPSGAIFSVSFIKKDNSIRDMNCRKGVTAGLKPNARSIAPDTKNITVFDMALAKSESDPSKAYRKINPETVITIKAERQQFVVRG